MTDSRGSRLDDVISIDDFRRDAHAARYVPEFEKRPEAGRRLLAILNQPANEPLLIHEAGRGDPALDGVVRMIEADPEIQPILASGAAGHRFRQTVGVAIRLRMEQLGWRKARSKGVVRGADYFKRAERFERHPDEAGQRRERALAGLDRVARIGTEEERRDTGDTLMEALRETRAAQSRPF